MKKTTMMTMVLVAAALACAQVFAQTPTLTFTAQTTTGAGSVVPKLTWSTSPAAQSCAASGDWSGVKGASGTETLPEITASKTYTMTCTWPGDTTATMKWQAPTQNTDGSDLAKCASQTVTSGACLKRFNVYHGTSMSNLTDVKGIDDRNATTYAWTGLPAGMHYFGVKALNADGVASDMSNVASKAITSTQSVNRNVAITVNPQPNPPAGLTVE